MGILLFILCAVVSAIFFTFSQSSNSENIIPFSGNLFIEAAIFLCLGIVFFIYFSDFWKKEKAQEDQEESGINWWELGIFIKNIFKNYLYYIGFIFFYLSFYFILQSFDFGSFAMFVFIVNIIIALCFFITDKFFIFKDFVKINTILFSLLYIWFYFYIFFTGNNFFTSLDFVNSICIVIYFIMTLRFERVLLKQENLDTALTCYFSIYTAIFLLFYTNLFFFSLPFTITLLWTLLWTLLFVLTDKISYLSKSSHSLRIIALMFFYISAGTGVYYILYDSWSFIVIVLLIFLLFANYLVHKWYQNYVSFSVSFLLFLFLFSYLFFNVFYVGDYKDILLIANYSVIAFSLVFYTYYTKLQYIHDYYFFHIFWYTVNIFWIVLFFFFSWFDIFHIGILFLINSIFVFLSYYKLNSLEK